MVKEPKKNNLLKTVKPEIALDWDHDLNERSLDTITVYAHYNAHWKCHVCGHTWQAVVGSRSAGRGCPACGGQVVIKGKNDLASQFPDIAAEWDYSGNDPVTPDTVSFGAIKKYSWICPRCGYSYEASVNQRTNTKSGCPYCTNHKVKTGYNDFATKYPALAKEWDYQGNGDLSPDHILCNHHKKVKWICPTCNNSYDAYIYNRIRGDECPYCSGHRVLVGFNDLPTLIPELLSEWDYEYNKGVNPQDFTLGSNTSVGWKCEICGHRWKSQIVKRTNGSHCPKCNHRNHTSFPEQAVFYYLKQRYADAINGYSDIFEGPMELDIYIPSLCVGIEYDGIRWHTDETESREKRKYDICKSNGIKLIRIKEDGDVKDNCDVAIPSKYRRRDYKDLDQTIKTLFDVLDEDAPQIDTESDAVFINELFQVILREGSFGALYPQYLSEWDGEKNGHLTPYMFLPHSNEKMWWICPKCGRSYQMPFSSKAQGRQHLSCSYSERNARLRKRVKNLDTGMVFDSVSEAVAFYGEGDAKRKLISQCCNGHKKTALGYHWSYLENQDES